MVFQYPCELTLILRASILPSVYERFFLFIFCMLEIEPRPHAW